MCTLIPREPTGRRSANINKPRSLVSHETIADSAARPGGARLTSYLKRVAGGFTSNWPGAIFRAGTSLPSSSNPTKWSILLPRPTIPA
jgi:hypothetical protein